MDEITIKVLKDLIKVMQNVSMRQLSIMAHSDRPNENFPSVFKDTIEVAKKDVLELEELESKVIVVKSFLSGLSESQKKIGG